jgi:hypothetical protein
MTSSVGLESQGQGRIVGLPKAGNTCIEVQFKVFVYTYMCIRMYTDVSLYVYTWFSGWRL